MKRSDASGSLGLAYVQSHWGGVGANGAASSPMDRASGLNAMKRGKPRRFPKQNPEHEQVKSGEGKHGLAGMYLFFFFF